MKRIACYLPVLVLLCIAGSTACMAELVRVDLLGGLGDFEYGADVTWGSSYNGPDYDFAANSGWVSEPEVSGARWGYNLPGPDDQVAVGWMRGTSSALRPGANFVFRIAEGSGIGGSNCQHVAIRAMTSGSGTADLYTRFPVTAKGSDVRVGDRLVFRVESLRMVDYQNLPQGTTVSYRIALSWRKNDPNNPGSTIPVVVNRPIEPSVVPVSAEVEGVIDPGATSVTAYISVLTAGDLDGKQPGFYADGARAYLQRAESPAEYAYWEVPVRRDRSIQTMKAYFKPTTVDDVYEIATDYDLVMFQNQGDARFVARLRHLNPSIKVYLYESGGTITDWRDHRGIDAWYSNSPVGFAYATSNHPEWLYSNDAGSYVYDPKYPNHYYTRVSDPAYQSYWATRTVSFATLGRYDGVWVDALERLGEKRSGGALVCPARGEWEVQQFLHSVVPVLRSAGVEVIQNGCALHLETDPGRIYFDPFWLPEEPYTAPYYAANTPSICADSLYQEWAFFKHGPVDGSLANKYYTDYWLQCLADMDAIRTWNTADGDRALPANRKKLYHMLVHGVDRADDPAGGISGWLQFGLCSYLLGANEWTTLGVSKVGDYRAKVDLSITRRLGSPTGDHQAYAGDIYLRYRLYDADGSGGQGGVVIANGNLDGPRTYTLLFDAVDESGNFADAGTSIVLPPHSGRIFLRQVEKVYIRVAVPTATVVPGQVLSISVEYVNRGAAATNVVLRAKVPDGMKYVAGSGGEGAVFDPSSGTVSWIAPSVAAGERGSRTFQAKVD